VVGFVDVVGTVGKIAVVFELECMNGEYIIGKIE